MWHRPLLWTSKWSGSYPAVLCRKWETVMGKTCVDVDIRKESGFESQKSYVIFMWVKGLGGTGDGQLVFCLWTVYIVVSPDMVLTLVECGCVYRPLRVLQKHLCTHLQNGCYVLCLCCRWRNEAFQVKEQPNSLSHYQSQEVNSGFPGCMGWVWRHLTFASRTAKKSLWSDIGRIKEYPHDE